LPPETTSEEAIIGFRGIMPPLSLHPWLQAGMKHVEIFYYTGTLIDS